MGHQRGNNNQSFVSKHINMEQLLSIISGENIEDYAPP
jgi:hypothetical protein